MQSRKIPLATMVMSAMARWNRLHHLERARRSHGDIRRPVRVEAKRRIVDAGAHGVRGRAPHGADGEPVDPVRIAGEPLQVIEMQPDAIVVACDLGGIRLLAW